MTEMTKNGVDPLSVKQLANHHSLEITNIYTNHVDPNLRDIILSKAPKFSKGKEERKDEIELLHSQTPL